MTCMFVFLTLSLSFAYNCLSRGICIYDIFGYKDQPMLACSQDFYYAVTNHTFDVWKPFAYIMMDVCIGHQWSNFKSVMYTNIT
jgi:hypothetical protein